MMIKVLLCLFVFFISLSGYGQNIFSGVVKDSTNKEILPFANIGIKGTSKGTNSDLEGNFVLKLSKEDTIVVSYVGYYEKMISYNDLESVIYLVPTELKLNEIVITSSNKNRSHSSNLGNFEKTFIIKGGANQYAMFIENEEKKTGSIRNVFFDVKPALKSESRWESLIRVRVYTIKNGVPNQDLLVESIEYRIKRKANSVKIDISNYNVFFPREGCFIGIDLLGFFNEKNEYIPYSTTNVPIDTRVEFSLVDKNKSITFSKFFGTEWNKTIFRTLQGENKVVGAKFRAKIDFYED